MESHKEENTSRVEFEKWWEEKENSLLKKEFPSGIIAGIKSYSWAAWQASRESLEANRDKNFCWVVYFKDVDVNIKPVAVPFGWLHCINNGVDGMVLCWSGETTGKSEEDALKSIQPTIDKMKLDVTDIDIWEE